MPSSKCPHSSLQIPVVYYEQRVHGWEDLNRNSSEAKAGDGISVQNGKSIL